MVFHFAFDPLPDVECAVCGYRSPLIAAHLGVCVSCVRGRPEEARALVQAAHSKTRDAFDLPASAPHTENGVRCPLCANECILGDGERGFCGLRTAREGKLVHIGGTPDLGLLHWYRDPLPTNCVGMWTCAGMGQRGTHNLAVFYGSCTLNCLFCQNWHYRDMLPTEKEIAEVLRKGERATSLKQRGLTAQELAATANDRSYCVCYFGGDPASQMTHALASASIFAERGLVICWETSGTANPRLMDRALQYSLDTDGIVKFDLKAYAENLHIALTGISNKRTLENFARAARRFGQRPELPLVMASTLLVPGYVDAEEVGRIAKFIASFSPDIPYSLLGFGPHFYMPDQPTTSVNHADEAQAAARDAGLTNVRVGNRHLLSRAY